MKIIIATVLSVITSLLLNDFAAVAAAKIKTAPRAAATQPFTYANVVSSFKEAHLRATEVQPRCTIFLRRRMEERERLRLLRHHG
jgi:hypothetical protein